ncbi:MAG: hemerythrin family protein [Lamprocystis purpurea]|jgi:hemerythrin-like metal-binding protein|uniref:bacteriohemerythrin n=1 Tax=Lamprocystis purpurea TaxID=61598 RepID=UPI00035F407A|nr:hemerythrin family protein [Lamprocystis purpurea]MBV5276050.1 hemerythrin family protein [Lamprocystis purpurea]
MPLILDFESRFLLGIPAMDHVHRELVELLNRMADAGNATFAYLYPDLVNHTHAHFANEEVLMRQSGFPAMQEHMDEHARLRGELDAFGQALDGRRIDATRAFVAQQLPAWFARHTTTMDSALAAHLKGTARIKKPPPQEIVR